MDEIKTMLGNKKAILGVKVGFEDQKMVFAKLNELQQPGHYLSTLIVKKKPQDYTRL